MATRRQTSAAKRNIKKAQRAARKKKTITKLPKAVRSDLGRQAAKSRKRGGKPGRALEDRTRQDLYKVAKRKGIAGRSRMGKWDLIRAPAGPADTGRCGCRVLGHLQRGPGHQEHAQRDRERGEKLPKHFDHLRSVDHHRGHDAAGELLPLLLLLRRALLFEVLLGVFLGRLAPALVLAGHGTNLPSGGEDCTLRQWPRPSGWLWSRVGASHHRDVTTFCLV
jgi:hypothetical protein